MGGNFLFLDVHVWPNGHTKERMWGVIKGMYKSSRSILVLNREKLEVFYVEEGIFEDVAYCFLCS